MRRLQQNGLKKKVFFFENIIIGHLKLNYLKYNANYEVVEKLNPKYRNILSDQLIRFSGYEAKKKCLHILRKVVLWDKVEEREIDLLTKHLDFCATTISAIYKDRWQIEIFLRL